MSVLQEKVKNLQAELLKIKNDKTGSIFNLILDPNNNNNNNNLNSTQHELIEYRNRLLFLLKEITEKKNQQIFDLEQKCKIFEEHEERFKKTVLELKLQAKLREKKKLKIDANENESEEIAGLKQEIASLKKLLECNPQVTELARKNLQFQG